MLCRGRVVVNKLKFGINKQCQVWDFYLEHLLLNNFSNLQNFRKAYRELKLPFTISCNFKNLICIIYRLRRVRVYLHCLIHRVYKVKPVSENSKKFPGFKINYCLNRSVKWSDLCQLGNLSQVDFFISTLVDVDFVLKSLCLGVFFFPFFFFLNFHIL